MSKRIPRRKSNILKRAEEHIFSTGIGDGTSHLCLTNMKYGLAKMHIVQHNLGIDPDATFISTPDETISRNTSRWEQGISYGGKLSWGPGAERLIVLDVKPNLCGMLVAGLDELPRPETILKRIHELEYDDSSIDGIKVNWDFYKGNHFIDVFKVKVNESKLKLPKYAVILHSRCPELKGQTDKGPGLYWNKSEHLQQVMTTCKTPFGPVYTLQERDALEYFRFHEFADKFAKKRREKAFKHLFGKGKIICNKTHQGLLNLNEAGLGCQHFESSKELLPISIRADLPSYLVRGKHNFNEHQMDLLGFTHRAEQYGITRRLSKCNILPHGGGYAFTDSLSVDKIFEVNGKRYFEIDMVDGVGKKIISNVREIQFAYRGREVLQKTLDIGMCSVASIMEPLYTIKT